MKTYKINVNGKAYLVEVESVTETTTPAPHVTPKPEAPKASADGLKVVAPMQGAIIKVLVKPGDQVRKGQVLFVLEAMKLENDILAPSDGTILQVLVEINQKVDAQNPLCIFR
ncbi:MAG: biotin/lipoyl-containing protein [Candidatus Izemoplasmatales bacterium]|jgi:biotin carboxyl carrier protein